MWTWLLAVAGSLVGLVVLVALIGACLPKGHVATRAMRLSRPCAEVWDVVADFGRQAEWRTDLRGVERENRDGREVWREIRRDGSVMPLETVACEPPRRLVRRIADPKLPFGGTWTCELVEDDGGCVVRITEDGEVYNPIFRAVSKLMDMRATIDRYLKALAARFGEEPRLEE